MTSSLEQYRPPGRSNRSGRTQDNDVFEGLPVKQWGHATARISLAPPASQTASAKDDKWAEPPMPRDYQLLQPYTQQLLRLARSGKVSSFKRKQDADLDDDKPEDDATEAAKVNLDERGYIAKKWKPVPEHLLEPEHKHFGFLAKRRKGLPSLYGLDLQAGAPVTLRKTKVRKADANGEVAVYEVLVPEGQIIEGEVAETTELPEVKPVAAGTVIEGVGIANEEGVVVAEHLKPALAPRRNRPPPKKKGGPGRGKKRVTFTNPDGSTYTTVVPNATKIVPQPGQTVKHVAKGEEATADVTAEQAAAHATVHTEGEEDGSGSDDGDEGDEDDDDREEGEISQDDEAPVTITAPALEQTEAKRSDETLNKSDATETAPAVVESESTAKSPPGPDVKHEESRAKSSSPEHTLAESEQEKSAPPNEDAHVTPVEAAAEPVDPSAMDIEEGEKFDDGDDDLLGNLEKHIQGDTS